MAITNAQIAAIDKQRMELIFDDVNLGAVKPDTLRVQVSGNYQPVTIDQLQGVVKEWQEGFTINVQVTLMDVSPSFIYGTLMSGQVFAKTAASGDLFVGFGNRKIDMLNIAAELRLHEYGVDDTTRTLDWLFWKAKAKFDGTEFAYGATTIKELVVNFTIYPDLDKAVDYQYGGYGDARGYDAEAVPKGVWIATGKTAQVPGKHLTALTLNPSDLQDLQAFAAYSTNGTITAAINDATDINSTDTAIVYDTLAGGTIVAGDYILIDSEYMRVTANDTGTNTLTVQRGIWGSTAAAHLDNAVITVQTAVSIVRVTNWATWASSATADVTVGTTFGGSGTASIGRIAHVSSGSSNVTATVNTKASPNLVVTTN